MGEVDTSISIEEKGMGVDERNSGKDGSLSSEDVVRWEKFLPKMVLRVLLVEADDSTRRIIAALLRKCSYRVAAVPDGLKAWETLKGRPNNIDIVLTELDLPSISGYALLTLVREDDVCKNIPVIMMSSSNSISLVLKCMLKGAADFLIKPVRKNELRNLWQHVWRRKNLTAGNEPEKRRNVVYDAEATSGNNEVSNHFSGCVASREKIKDTNEKESNARGFSSHKSGSVSDLNKHEELKMDRGSITSKRTNGGLEIACHDSCNLSDLALPENQACAETVTQKGHTGAGASGGHTGVTTEAYHDVVDSYNGAIDFVSTFDSHQEGPLVHTTLSDGKAKPVFAPQLELSLRRFCPSILLDQRNSEQDALNHSDYSPFSRYGGKKTLPSLSLDAASAHTQVKEHENESDGLLPKQNLEHANGFSNVDKKGQVNMSNLRAEVALPTHELGLVHALRVSADNKDPAYAQHSPTIYYPQASLHQTRNPAGASHQEQSPLSGSTSINSNPRTLSIEQRCHRTDETMNNTVDQVPNDQMRPHEMVRRSPAGDQSLCSGVDDPVSSSTNESNFCKKDGSSTSDLTAEKLTAPANLNDGNLVSCDEFNGMQSGYTSQREAALMKFRLKRKDRCYDKKVRYESRKRLAEQRPRVKGQFVRQVQTNPSINDVSDCPSNS